MQDDLMDKIRVLECQIEQLETSLNCKVEAGVFETIQKAGSTVFKGISNAGNAALRQKQIMDKEASIKKQLQSIIDDFSSATSNLHLFQQRWDIIWKEIVVLDSIKHPPPAPQ